MFLILTRLLQSKDGFVSPSDPSDGGRSTISPPCGGSSGEVVVVVVLSVGCVGEVVMLALVVSGFLCSHLLDCSSKFRLANSLLCSLEIVFVVWLW